jgi:hypothetical protein
VPTPHDTAADYAGHGAQRAAMARSPAFAVREFSFGWSDSRRRWSHFRVPLFILHREPLSKYTGWCASGSTACDQVRRPDAARDCQRRAGVDKAGLRAGQSSQRLFINTMASRCPSLLFVQEDSGLIVNGQAARPRLVLQAEGEGGPAHSAAVRRDPQDPRRDPNQCDRYQGPSAAAGRRYMCG